ncbi:milk fat globule-EGF factor 8 protein S homeolog precursor [Xenopus laevis]|nr:milk fat globule-EGF factor 8 protein S homeolog precursor [Xenopus laevis]AAH80085.1 MGC84194 protein [Xenopus laevis]
MDGSVCALPTLVTFTLLTSGLGLALAGELCGKTPCLNGGTCLKDAPDNPFCLCPVGLTGIDCSITEKGPCDPNPCKSNGECHVLSDSGRGDTFVQYFCKCLPGYEGQNCEINKNQCYTNPCKNGGICKHLGDDFSCKCASPYIGKICNFRCANALGMEGRAILDAQIISSSLYHGFLGLQRWGPNLARLNNKGMVNAWTANSLDQHPWIQVNLLREMRVSGIITQGASRMGTAEYVKEFKVAYSVDGHEFTFYKSEGKDKLFPANIDNDGRKANLFSPPISAQFIRIFPVTCRVACTLRFELYGCEASVYFNMVGCSDPLGMKAHMVSDKQITASSVYQTWGVDAFTWYPHYARLDKIGKTNAWTALENNQEQWLQIDLHIPKKITGIITQGAKDFGSIQYVESFKVAYSDDGNTWKIYKDSRTKVDKIFLGNTDNYSHKKNLFDVPFSARFVRVLPQSWHERITLRMELLGCDH